MLHTVAGAKCLDYSAMAEVSAQLCRFAAKFHSTVEQAVEIWLVGEREITALLLTKLRTRLPIGAKHPARWCGPTPYRTADAEDLRPWVRIPPLPLINCKRLEIR